jgi:hypothetical protein
VAFKEKYIIKISFKQKFWGNFTASNFSATGNHNKTALRQVIKYGPSIACVE